MLKDVSNHPKSFLIYRIGDNLFDFDSDEVRNIPDHSYIFKGNSLVKK